MLDKRKNLCFLDTVTDQFEVILLVGEALTAAGLTDTIHFITRGLGASLLLTGDLGFYVFDMQQRSISKAYLNSEKSKSRLFAEWPVFAIQDYLGNYWVSHWGGILSKVDGASDQVTTYRYGDGMLTYDQGPPEINYFLPMFDDSTGSWFQCVTPNRTRTFFFITTWRQMHFVITIANSITGKILLYLVMYFTLTSRTGRVFGG
ncbi:MAG: hypothetical protein H6561_17050 [Lewinellaceae bacterium]|nr:hypothetical protein [Lewinellaceae bacterium]